MNITDVGTRRSGDALLVAVDTSDGLTGVGESVCWAFPESVELVVGKFARYLIGTDPATHRAPLAHDVADGAVPQRHRRVGGGRPRRGAVGPGRPAPRRAGAPAARRPVPRPDPAPPHDRRRRPRAPCATAARAAADAGFTAVKFNVLGPAAFDQALTPLVDEAMERMHRRSRRDGRRRRPDRRGAPVAEPAPGAGARRRAAPVPAALRRGPDPDRHDRRPDRASFRSAFRSVSASGGSRRGKSARRWPRAGRSSCGPTSTCRAAFRRGARSLPSPKPTTPRSAGTTTSGPVSDAATLSVDAAIPNVLTHEHCPEMQALFGDSYTTAWNVDDGHMVVPAAPRHRRAGRTRPASRAHRVHRRGAPRRGAAPRRRLGGATRSDITTDTTPRRYPPDALRDLPRRTPRALSPPPGGDGECRHRHPAELVARERVLHDGLRHARLLLPAVLHRIGRLRAVAGGAALRVAQRRAPDVAAALRRLSRPRGRRRGRRNRSRPVRHTRRHGVADVVGVAGDRRAASPNCSATGCHRSTGWSRRCAS